MNTFIRNALVVATLATAANAQTFLIGNLYTGGAANSSGGNAFSATMGATVNGGSQMIGFTMGAHSGEISYVELALNRNSAGSAANVRLYSGSGTPSTLESVTFTIDGSTPLGTAVSTVKYNASGGFTLTAGTTYWIVVENGGDENFSTITWSKESGGGEAVLGAGASYVGAARNSKSDLSGTYTQAVSTSILPNFAVYATVPEPHEYALIAGLGLVGFAAYRRRFQRATA